MLTGSAIGNAVNDTTIARDFKGLNQFDSDPLLIGRVRQKYYGVRESVKPGAPPLECFGNGQADSKGCRRVQGDPDRSQRTSRFRDERTAG
jgi:hypothetical protein